MGTFIIYSCLIFLCFTVATILEKSADYSFPYTLKKKLYYILTDVIGLGLSALLLIHLIFQATREASFLEFAFYVVLYCLDYVVLLIIFIWFCNEKIRFYIFNKKMNLED